MEEGIDMADVTMEDTVSPGAVSEEDGEVCENTPQQTVDATGLAEAMTAFKDKEEPTPKVTPTTPEDIFEAAKNCPWPIARQLFDEEVSRYTSAAQSAMTTKDWSSLKEVTLTVTMNANGNRYCCWECGGSKTTNGHAVIIGSPDGRKPLAMSAFRKCHVPNGKQAVIQVWPGCIIAIATQSRGIGIVLLYRIAEVKPVESVYVQQNRYKAAATGESVYHFSVVLQLNKVFNISTQEVTQFYNDLNNITAESDIVKAAIRKCTIFNCQQAIYIRPFFTVKDGYKNWDIDTVPVEDTYLEPNRVSSFFNETLALLSNLVRDMPVRVFPYLGMQVVEEFVPDVPFDWPEGKEVPEEDRSVLVKFAVFTEKSSHAWNVEITKSLFHQHREFFANVRNFTQLLEKARDTGPHQVLICKYAGN